MWLGDMYREHPEAALITLRAKGRVGEGIRCKLETGKALVEAGLHPATGGSGAGACSGDMLLEALVAGAGVTLRAVATALVLGIHPDLCRPVFHLLSSVLYFQAVWRWPWVPRWSASPNRLSPVCHAS